MVAKFSTFVVLLAIYFVSSNAKVSTKKLAKARELAERRSLGSRWNSWNTGTSNGCDCSTGSKTWSTWGTRRLRKSNNWSKGCDCSTPTPKPPCPSPKPTEKPNVSLTDNPTSSRPTETPSSRPTETPSSRPTETPSSRPTETPSSRPTETPSSRPTETPSSRPTETPSSRPTETPSSRPTESPSSEPTLVPTEITTTDNCVTEIVMSYSEDGPPVFVTLYYEEELYNNLPEATTADGTVSLRFTPAEIGDMFLTISFYSDVTSDYIDSYYATLPLSSWTNTDNPFVDTYSEEWTLYNDEITVDVTIEYKACNGDDFYICDDDGNVASGFENYFTCEDVTDGTGSSAYNPAALTSGGVRHEFVLGLFTAVVAALWFN